MFYESERFFAEEKGASSENTFQGYVMILVKPQWERRISEWANFLNLGWQL